MRQIIYYSTSTGREPCREWLNNLPQSEQAIIYAYIDRVAMGGAKKNIKPVGDGVFEIKIDRGPGYRVYFGQIGTKIIFLLLGGYKGSQNKDIRLAKEYWRNYETK